MEITEKRKNITHFGSSVTQNDVPVTESPFSEENVTQNGWFFLEGRKISNMAELQNSKLQTVEKNCQSKKRIYRR